MRTKGNPVCSVQTSNVCNLIRGFYWSLLSSHMYCLLVVTSLPPPYPTLSPILTCRSTLI